MQVLTVIRKNILHKVIIDNQTDLVSQLYCSILDIKELHSLTKNEVMRKTKVVNLHNNKVGRG